MRFINVCMARLVEHRIDNGEAWAADPPLGGHDLFGSLLRHLGQGRAIGRDGPMESAQYKCARSHSGDGYAIKRRMEDCGLGGGREACTKAQWMEADERDRQGGARQWRSAWGGR